MKNINKWNSLSIKDKADLMKLYVKNGINNLEEIRNHYNKFATGGYTEEDEEYYTVPTKQEYLEEVKRKALKSANTQGVIDKPKTFVERVLENSQSARDARIGAVGAQQIRDLYKQGKTKQAQKLAEDYTKANMAGIALGAAGPTIISAYSNPFVRTALDVVSGIDGIRNATTDNGIRKTIRLAKKGDTWETIKSGIGDVFDVAGISDLVRIASRFNKTNRALHAYNTISPEGYDSPMQRFKNWAKDIIQDNPVDINNPKWEIPDRNEVPYLTDSYNDIDVKNKIYKEARNDAWRLYNGLPQKHGTYIKNADGTYAYDLERINNIDPNFNPSIDSWYDDVTGAGGGLTHNSYITLGEEPGKANPKSFGVRTIEDVWDLHPFSREGDKINTKIENYLKNKIGTQKFRDAAQEFRRYMYKKGHWDIDSGHTLLGKATHFLDSPLNQYRTGYRTVHNSDGTIGLKDFSPTMDNLINKFTHSKFMDKITDKVSKIEAGTIIGGKPFTMHTEIPITRENKIIESLNKSMPLSIIRNNKLGFKSEELLPPKVLYYKKHGNLNGYFDDYNNENISFLNIENIPFLYNKNYIIDNKNKFQDGGNRNLGIPWMSLNSDNYDYYNASTDNMPTKKGEHWTSRNPKTGRILKGTNHPTIDVALNMEGILGNKVYKNVDGTYSSYEGNQFPTSLGTHINNYEYDVSPLDPNKRCKGIKTTKGRKYNEDNITYISDKLNNTLLNDAQKNAILGSIIEESGGNPFAVDTTGKFKGLLQWEDSRYSPNNSLSEREEIDNQLNYLIETLYNTEDRKSWTHGGKGSGYKSSKHARDSFLNTNDLYEAVHSLNRGYIRPTGGDYSVKNRYNVAKQIK